jgi:hypothetical protein
MKAVYVFALVVLLYACQRPLVVQNHTKETIYKDSLVLVPGGQVTNTIYYDSLKIIPIDHWYEHTDTTSKTQLRYMMDRLGRLNMQAKCPPDTIKVRHTHTIEQTNDVHVKEIKYIPWWMYLCAFIQVPFSIIGLVYMVGRNNRL